MPELSNSEHDLLVTWFEKGAQTSDIAPLSQDEKRNIAQWESFFNGDCFKQQLTSRYLYEHLFLNHLYFSSDPDTLRFFKLVRSATPPGEEIALIATRRPYDDPNVDRVYYRITPVRSTIVDKTHMPYLLDQARFNKWDQSFIKGPVCRGQLALNVINDHFWVFFVDPQTADNPKDELFALLRNHIGSNISQRYDVTNSKLMNTSHKLLKTIDTIQGSGLQHLPQIITVKIIADANNHSEFFTLFNTSAHKNISSLFNEESNRMPEQDHFSLLYGVVGSYPAAFLEIKESQLKLFIAQLRNISSEDDYIALLDRFAIRRSSVKFWPYSDELTEWYKTHNPIEAGLLDYNRFENR